MSPAAKPRVSAPPLDAVAGDTLRGWKCARKRLLRHGARRGDVHQWRIATRRLFAAERLLAPSAVMRLRPTPLERELQRAFRAAGRVRDAHVGLALAREFAPTHPVARAVAVALRQRLPRQRRKLRRRLERVRITRLRRIMDGWSIVRAGGKAADAAAARRSVARLTQARRRIARALASIPPHADPGALHRLRIEVKHARYMSGLCAAQPSANPGEAAGRRLADWQRELGIIADLGAFDAHAERYALDDPTRAADVRRLRRALAQRQRRLVASFLRRHRVA